MCARAPVGNHNFCATQRRQPIRDAKLCLRQYPYAIKTRTVANGSRAGIPMLAQAKKPSILEEISADLQLCNLLGMMGAKTNS